MRKLVISDIHGAYKALTQVLNRAKFNPDKDQLIFMGDICDGWAYTTECVELLNDIPNLVQLLGNHDDWCLRWLNAELNKAQHGLSSDEYQLWYEQGGKATIDSMTKHNSHELLYEFLNKSDYYYEDDNNLFVHAGIDLISTAAECDSHTLIWDRLMVKMAQAESLSKEPVVTEYDKVFCGHTPTIYFSGIKKPINYNNVWLCDTGASYEGPLSIMDVKTKEVFQSDPVIDLYPQEKAR